MNAPFDQLSTWLKEHRITEVECVISAWERVFLMLSV